MFRFSVYNIFEPYSKSSSVETSEDIIAAVLNLVLTTLIHILTTT